MHPIERLRYVARSSGSDQRVLVHETAEAIRGLGVDAAGLVVACRRIVERHPTSGPLWWLCASLLGSPEPVAASRSLAREVETDPTPDHLMGALADDTTVCTVGWPDLVAEAVGRRGDSRVLAVDVDGQGSSLVRRLQREGIDAEVVEPAGAAIAALASDAVVVEALACSTTDVVVAAGSRALASVAACSGIPVWLVVGRARRLPAAMVAAMTARLATAPHGWRPTAESMPVDLCTWIVGPRGRVAIADAARELTAECPFTPELLRPSPT
jgi:hypothetical protein